MNSVIFDFGEDREYLTPKQFNVFVRVFPLLRNRESDVLEIIHILQAHVQ